VVLNVPHWLLMPEILTQTDMVAVISSKLAASFSKEMLVTKPLPFESPSFSWMLYWHRRYDNSVPHKWMRDLIQSCCVDL
jgi:DNA-binding transcriptional LysR family regulator